MPRKPPQHAALRKGKVHRPAERRGSAARRGYDHRWRRLRRWFLARHPLCTACLEAGRTTPAAHVHHVKPLRSGGERFDPGNLMALCGSCHARLEAREITRRGRGG